jgi:hypothetical protein
MVLLLTSALKNVYLQIVLHDFLGPVLLLVGLAVEGPVDMAEEARNNRQAR